jgi:hypothetical protein
MKGSKELEIAKEEFKKAGIDVAEEVLESIVHTTCEKVVPRLVLESENPIVKSVAGVVAMAYPAMKPAIDKATDLNHDGQ